MGVQENFWRWFVQNEAELFSFDATRIAEREPLFDRIASELAKIEPNLTFEFGPPAPVREFIISAAGIREAFPAVSALVEKRPHLEKWEIVAFRPRRPVSGGSIHIDGVIVRADDVRFSLIETGQFAGIYLFIPGFDKRDIRLKQIGYLLLDEALGEYDVETGLGPIEMLPPEADVKHDRYPLPKLPALFDQMIARLQGQSQRLQ